MSCLDDCLGEVKQAKKQASKQASKELYFARTRTPEGAERRAETCTKRNLEEAARHELRLGVCSLEKER